MNRFLEIDLETFRVETLPFLIETGARILVMSSEGNFDVGRNRGMGCSQEDADSLKVFYNERLQES